MFFTEQKLRNRIRELEPYRYLERAPIGNWRIKEDGSKMEKYPPKIDESWKELTAGSHWEGRDYYLWLQTDFLVPELKEGEEIVLLIDFGKTGGGNNSGFESLLFINNEPYQGVDSNHKEVFIHHQYSGQKIQLALKLWSGLEGGGPQKQMRHQFLYGDYAILSPETDNLYYTAKVMLDTVSVLDKNEPDRYTLLNILENTFQKIDWSEAGERTFYKSIEQANLFIQQAMNELPKNSPITVTAIGHTHIDVAWLWRLKHTREKAARSFSTVLRLMERYPEYIFLQTQPQLYAYIKEDYPEVYQKIQEKIKAGKWEVDGAMWLEADCNIPSGESFVRQLLHGTRFIKQEFNQDVSYLWLPDVFGYSWALPQILKKSGINTFMTTKISWNQYNRMPHDTFKWRGIDGSEVLTHFITTPDAGDEQGRSHYTYNGSLEPATVKGIYDNYRDKDFNNQLLLSYGYGDGGGGVNRDMLESRQRLDVMPGLPQVKTGKAKEYFEKLHQTVEQTDNYVHTWDGELYLEYHRGTYTSQAFVKKWNRKLELAYREIELLNTWGQQTQEDWPYPAEEIHKGWQTILRNQFHDIIPGSSIHEVYEDAELEYQEANELYEGMRTKFTEHFIQQEENSWSLFNSAGWARQELVVIPMMDNGYFIDEEQKILPSSKGLNGYEVEIPKIEALSSKVITFVPAEEKMNGALPESSFKIDSHSIETPYYEVSWNDKGQLTQIFDKEYNRHVLKPDGLGNYFQLFEDKPMKYDAWDIDLYYVQKQRVLDANKIEVLSNDALSTKIAFTYQFGKSTIIQEMNLYSQSRRIDFKTKVDWQERQQLLKASFDVDIRATEATYNIQFGNVKRPTHWNNSWDMARFESVAHQWVDFAERDYGVGLLNDCKYGHNVKNHTMSLSLLKGAIHPDPDADLGKHEFTYSLLPHGGDFIDGQVMEEAWSLNNPLQAHQGNAGQTSFFKLSSQYPVEIDAIKQREDGQGVILRLHDHTGSKRTITLEPQFKFTGWQETNLLEVPVEGTKINSSEKITLELNPYEIKTILIN